MTQNTIIKNQIIQNQLFTFTAGLTLAECEKDIEMINKLTDAARGERFNRIKENKLYRETHDTWENYCQDRWELTPQRVGQLIQFAKTCQLIKSETQVSILPESETQTRPLNQLPPEQKITAWNIAVESANGEQPTANQVRTATNKELMIDIYCPECGEKKQELNYWHKKNIDENNTCRHCKKTNPNKNWLTQPKQNQTHGPAAQWLEKEKSTNDRQTSHELTTPMYCPDCGHKQETLTTWLTNENIMKRGLLKCEQCEKSMNLISWLTEPKSPNIRYCPDCNHKQTLTDKAIEHNNEVQCSNCKSHARAKGWLTSPGKPWKHCPSCEALWRNQNGLQQRNYYKPEQLQIYQCTEETCPICERKGKQKIKAEKPYYPRPETAIDFLTNISPEMTITINELDRALADPALKYEIINRIYEKINESYEPDILGELADLW
jgi:transcription elongation factor Elf1